MLDPNRHAGEPDDGTWQEPARDEATQARGAASFADLLTPPPSPTPTPFPDTVPAVDSTTPPPSTSAGRDSGVTGGAPPRPEAHRSDEWDQLPAPIIEAGRVVFGKYLLEKKLGEGGMGEVWLVENLNIQRESALKLIKPEIAQNSKGWKRFEREARLMAKITHPNAVGIYDFSRSHSMGYIEMEYVRGQSLEKFLRDRGDQPMTLEWTADVLDQLCSVLQEAHGYVDEKKGKPRPIVHRDLKPSNLMLVDRKPAGQNLKVLDFGIAKMTADEGNMDVSLTGAGDLVGTPAYMSPEQIRGGITKDGRGDIDGRSDLYSVGVLLYQLLTGVLPFRGMSKMAMLAAHLNADPPPMGEANPAAKVPPAVERVVMRCLEKEADRRPQSARELAEQFRAAVRESVGTKRERTPLPVPASWLLGLAGVAVAAAVAVGSFAVLNHDHSIRKPPPPPPPPPPIKTTDGDASEWARLGYEPLDAETLASAAREQDKTWDSTLLDRDARPPGLRRTEDQVFFYGFAPGIYLPVGYRPKDRADKLDFWPRVLVRSSDGARFIRISGGRFTQGDFRSGDATSDLKANDLTAHEVVVPGSYIQETEVTNREIERYLETHADIKLTEWDAARQLLLKSMPPDQAGKCPAVCIGRGMAQRYARSVGGRLPTESEWEYAARSGGKRHLWAGGNLDPRKGNKANLTRIAGGVAFLAPVDAFQGADETEQQVLDMTGNAREWCLDPYKPYKQILEEEGRRQGALDNPPVGREPDAKDAKGAKALYVVRGGSWLTDSDSAMTFQRDGVEANVENPDLGFRVVLDCPPDLTMSP